jgi:hypothetical protein
MEQNESKECCVTFRLLLVFDFTVDGFAGDSSTKPAFELTYAWIISVRKWISIRLQGPEKKVVFMEIIIMAPAYLTPQRAWRSPRISHSKSSLGAFFLSLDFAAVSMDFRVRVRMRDGVVDRV